MVVMQHSRRNDLWRGGAPSDIRPDLTPALWIWYHCTPETGEILSHSLAEDDGGLIPRRATGAKGLLIIASFSTFREGTARSSNFTRESFYRERDGLSS